MKSASPLGRRLGWIAIVTVLGFAVTILAAPLAHAATKTYSASIPSTQTSWTQTVTVDQFDPAIGELQSVTIALDVAVAGEMAIENFSTTSPASATLGLSAAITASNGGTTLVQSDLAVSESIELEVFDGTIDFAGTSGATLSDIADNATTIEVLTDLDAIAAFIGTDTIALDVEAVSDNIVTSSTGNDVSQFAAEAGADIVVTYDYEIPAIDIAIAPDVQTIAVGDDAPLDVTVTNTGALPLVDVVVANDRVPSCDADVGDLEVGESTTYDCTADNVIDTVTDVATARGETVRGTQVTDSDDATVEVTAQQTTTTAPPETGTTPPPETGTTAPPTTPDPGEGLPVTGANTADLAWIGIVVLSLGGALVGIERSARGRREQS